MQIAQLASTAFIKGAPVYIDGNGFLAPSTTASIGAHVGISTATAIISGFAQEAGAGSASNTSKVGMIPLVPGMTFKGQLIDTVASGLGTIEQTDLGAHMGLALLSGDTLYGVDKTTTGSTDCLIVTELIDPVGTVGGMVGFVVRDTWNTWRA
jgi:hypothetical protein